MGRRDVRVTDDPWAGRRNRLSLLGVRTNMRRRLTLLLSVAAPFLLAGCGKGKY
ncbi:MAG: hypothetical protein ACXWZY_01995 [Gaiellaceae bacterium]